jgi:hypothetical protein
MLGRRQGGAKLARPPKDVRAHITRGRERSALDALPDRPRTPPELERRGDRVYERAGSVAARREE